MVITSKLFVILGIIVVLFDTMIYARSTSSRHFSRARSADDDGPAQILLYSQDDQDQTEDVFTEKLSDLTLDKDSRKLPEYLYSNSMPVLTENNVKIRLPQVNYPLYGTGLPILENRLINSMFSYPFLTTATSVGATGSNWNKPERLPFGGITSPVGGSTKPAKQEKEDYTMQPMITWIPVITFNFCCGRFGENCANFNHHQLAATAATSTYQQLQQLQHQQHQQQQQQQQQQQPQNSYHHLHQQSLQSRPPR